MLASVRGHPPAGPALRRGATFGAGSGRTDLCAQDEGFNLHAATRAGALDAAGREALLRYILRPPVAQERIARGPDNLVRIALKKPFSDGSPVAAVRLRRPGDRGPVAVDMDPLSHLLRLCAAVPAPRFHTVRYADVLASASKLRPKIVRRPPDPATATEQDDDKPKRSRYWPWAELMARTFALDVTAHTLARLPARERA